MGISQPVSIVGISQLVSISIDPNSEFYILDFDGNQIFDTDNQNILEYSEELP